jgi:hypothetical protein
VGHGRQTMAHAQLPPQAPAPWPGRSGCARRWPTSWPAVHEAYLAQARLLAPAAQARLPLLQAPRLTVAAAGARNLHVIGTAESFPAPVGQEVEVTGEADGLAWELRFFDPVVLPVLGLVAETDGPAPEEVRRVLGVGTYLYHLVVEPGSQLTPHHATHAGTGLASAHATAARELGRPGPTQPPGAGRRAAAPPPPAWSAPRPSWPESPPATPPWPPPPTPPPSAPPCSRPSGCLHERAGGGDPLVGAERGSAAQGVRDRRGVAGGDRAGPPAGAGQVDGAPAAGHPDGRADPGA